MKPNLPSFHRAALLASTAAALLVLGGCSGMANRGAMRMDAPSAGTMAGGPMATTAVDAGCAQLRLQAAEGRTPQGTPMRRAGTPHEPSMGGMHGHAMPGGAHGPMSQPLASMLPTQEMRCGVDRSEVYVNP